MIIDAIKKRIRECAAVGDFLEKATNGDNLILLGVSGSLKCILLSLLADREGGMNVIFVPDRKTALTLRDDCEYVTGKEAGLFLSYDPYFFTDAVQNQEVFAERLSSIKKFISGNDGIYIIDTSSLIYPLKSPQELNKYYYELVVGNKVDYESFIENIHGMGFERQKMVEEHGDFSVRGGIVDIFPPTFENPVRIELDGDVVESIRAFDVTSQRSVYNHNKMAFYSVRQDISIEDGRLNKDRGVLLFDYIPDRAHFFTVEPLLFRKKMNDHQQEIIEHLSREDENSFCGEGDFIEPDEIIGIITEKYAVGISFESIEGSKTIDFSSSDSPSFKRDLSLLGSEMSKLYEKDFHVYISCDNDGQAERLQEFFEDDPKCKNVPIVRTGSLSEGFILPGAKCAVFTDHQIFHREKWRRARKKYVSSKKLAYNKSLSIGDYVVHEDYGIGRYSGLTKIKIGGSLQEVLKILYSGNDSLYVNIDLLHKLEKYSGQDGVHPKLYKLGSVDWDKVKKKTKKSIHLIVKELLEIYAARKMKRGYSFSSDTQWQRELEASFLYEETPGQLLASREIKYDMESPKIMDRLVCGDVGYGKTEVALRAAFKAVNDSKQVAVLVPTTILAQQHYDTFVSRLQKYPVSIEMLSRFKSQKEQKQIIKKVQSGSVDVIIGTHRLLSKDVLFKSLGLMVVDEEQRFGVRHKEKLKKFREEVDVLTLTATPIPRTLNMSLLGIRDLSNIETPPKERLPIITEIIQFDDVLVRNAILREIDRGGQVYFVHNRVKTIGGLASRLKRIVPGSRIAIAHGQMKEKNLETVMIDFLEKRYDILVTTSIIESGLDIPNVNTIIINRADAFGLSQLYQIRGRVGRSNVQAYAYLVVPSIEGLEDIALKRLLTIKSYTELGSGFKIALKDLEIRGAGNLIGREQSGFVNAVGYDMYNKLVQQAVGDLKKENPEAGQDNNNQRIDDVKIISDIDAFFPEDYIKDSEERVNFYRRLSESGEISQIDEICEEITDRYGKYPQTVSNLLQLISVKILAKQAALEYMTLSADSFSAEFIKGMKDDMFKKYIISLSKYAPENFSFFQGKKFGFNVSFQSEYSDSDRLKLIQDFLEKVVNDINQGK
ncbi:transcription-repair coupling factor [candidate division KSB1 bacterium]